ncbi:MAG TPA: hypothetical protein VIG30_00020 [Ktedonobacterales bacterium]
MLARLRWWWEDVVYAVADALVVLWLGFVRWLRGDGGGVDLASDLASLALGLILGALAAVLLCWIVWVALRIAPH